jgi:hypothetical protein
LTQIAVSENHVEEEEEEEEGWMWNALKYIGY